MRCGLTRPPFFFFFLSSVVTACVVCVRVVKRANLQTPPPSPIDASGRPSPFPGPRHQKGRRRGEESTTPLPCLLFSFHFRPLPSLQDDRRSIIRSGRVRSDQRRSTTSIFCPPGSFSLASCSAFLEPTTAVVARYSVCVSGEGGGGRCERQRHGWLDASSPRVGECVYQPTPTPAPAPTHISTHTPPIPPSLHPPIPWSAPPAGRRTP